MSAVSWEIRRLNRALDSKETEISHLRGVLRHLRDEAEVKANSAQQKYDELFARFIEAEEKLELCEGSDRIAEEHAEYEAVIRRGGGFTISEAEQKIKEIVTRCGEFGKTYGRKSKELREQVDELVKIGNLYQTVRDRNPRLKQYLASLREPASSARPPSSPKPIPRTTLVKKHAPEVYQRERELRGRGRSRGGSAGRGGGRSRGGSSGRKSAKKQISIDTLLGDDFCNKWLNFSPRPPGPPA